MNIQGKKWLIILFVGLIFDTIGTGNQVAGQTPTPCTSGDDCDASSLCVRGLPDQGNKGICMLGPNADCSGVKMLSCWPEGDCDKADNKCKVRPGRFCEIYKLHYGVMKPFALPCAQNDTCQDYRCKKRPGGDCAGEVMTHCVKNLGCGKSTASASACTCQDTSQVGWEPCKASEGGYCGSGSQALCEEGLVCKKAQGSQRCKCMNATDEGTNCYFGLMTCCEDHEDMCDSALKLICELHIENSTSVKMCKGDEGAKCSVDKQCRTDLICKVNLGAGGVCISNVGATRLGAQLDSEQSKESGGTAVMGELAHFLFAVVTTMAAAHVTLIFH